MDRLEFERLRDLPDKYVEGDIVLKRPVRGADYFESEKIRIISSAMMDAYVVVRWNEETDSKTVNTFIVGVGPICRLDVDGKVHAPAGRHHKHSLIHPRCPDENLKRGITRRDELAGLTIQQVFTEFCRNANIRHDGTLRVQL